MKRLKNSLSSAGANWSWDFKDNTGSTDRSPYHTFTSTGIYQVSQQIDGPSTFSRTITVVTSFSFKNKSLPAILPLLLLPD
jgi:PKD repeat protein